MAFSANSLFDTEYTQSLRVQPAGIKDVIVFDNVEQPWAGPGSSSPAESRQTLDHVRYFVKTDHGLSNILHATTRR